MMAAAVAGPDAGERVERGGVGGVEVDPRRRAAGPPVPGPPPSTRHRSARRRRAALARHHVGRGDLAPARHVDPLAVAHGRREVDAVRIGVGSQAARGGDEVGHPGLGRDVVDARPQDRARGVHRDRGRHRTRRRRSTGARSPWPVARRRPRRGRRRRPTRRRPAAAPGPDRPRWRSPTGPPRTRRPPRPTAATTTTRRRRADPARSAMTAPATRSAEAVTPRLRRAEQGPQAIDADLGAVVGGRTGVDRRRFRGRTPVRDPRWRSRSATGRARDRRLVQARLPPTDRGVRWGEAAGEAVGDRGARLVGRRRHRRGAAAALSPVDRAGRRRADGLSTGGR